MNEFPRIIVLERKGSLAAQFNHQIIGRPQVLLRTQPLPVGWHLRSRLRRPTVKVKGPTGAWLRLETAHVPLESDVRVQVRTDRPAVWIHIHTQPPDRLVAIEAAKWRT